MQRPPLRTPPAGVAATRTTTRGSWEPPTYWAIPSRRGSRGKAGAEQGPDPYQASLSGGPGSRPHSARGQPCMHSRTHARQVACVYGVCVFVCVCACLRVRLFSTSAYGPFLCVCSCASFNQGLHCFSLSHHRGMNIGVLRYIGPNAQTQPIGRC